MTARIKSWLIHISDSNVPTGIMTGKMKSSLIPKTATLSSLQVSWQQRWSPHWYLRQQCWSPCRYHDSNNKVLVNIINRNVEVFVNIINSNVEVLAGFITATMKSSLISTTATLKSSLVLMTARFMLFTTFNASWYYQGHQWETSDTSRVLLYKYLSMTNHKNHAWVNITTR